MKKIDAAIGCLREELHWFGDNYIALEALRKLLRRDDTSSMNFNQVDPEVGNLLKRVSNYTMLPKDRLFSLYNLAKKVCLDDYPGNFVECGVWAGGSSVVLATAIKRFSKRKRVLYAFDSFEGMPRPTDQDKSLGIHAEEMGWGTGTCSASESCLAEISAECNVMDIIVPVKGYFKETLPVWKEVIGPVAFLHMDADWYGSTKAILENLYDQVISGGYIQIDDYGHWEGCRQAIIEFETLRGVSFDLNQIDYTSHWLQKK